MSLSGRACRPRLVVAISLALAIAACGEDDEPLPDARLACGQERAGDTSACSVEWTCDGERYEVACTWTGTEYDCRCTRNGVAGATFTSGGFCTVADDAAQKPAANSGCLWSVP